MSLLIIQESRIINSRTEMEEEEEGGKKRAGDGKRNVVVTKSSFS